jgi:hypothetical protein
MAASCPRVPRTVKRPRHQVHGFFWIPFGRGGRSMANHIGDGINFDTRARAAKAARRTAVVTRGFRPDQIPAAVGLYDNTGRLLKVFCKKGRR